MRLSPLLTKQLQDAEELGEERGIERGQRMERLTMIENFFRFKIDVHPFIFA